MGYFEALYFFFQFAIVLSGCLAVYSYNSVYSIFYLVLVFCNTSGLLLLVGIDFIAMVLLVIYVGAIAVLFLFVVMMTDIKEGESFFNYTFLTSSILILCVLIIELNVILYRDVMCIYGLYDMVYAEEEVKTAITWFSYETYTHNYGTVIFIHYPEILVLSGIILLISMIGAIILTLTYKISVKRQFIFEQNLRSDFIKFYK